MNLQFAEKKINLGVVGGILYIFLGIIYHLISGTLNIYIMIDLVILIIFLIGLALKSRICSLLLFSYFLFINLLPLLESREARGLLWIVIFTYCFLSGIYGTFTYHKIQKDKLREREERRKFLNQSR